jgi:mRNA-degrading endonuclease RelE of RelBE toxin-antitoxin system
MYSIVFSEDAKKDLKSLQKKAPQALIKLAKLLDCGPGLPKIAQ